MTFKNGKYVCNMCKKDIAKGTGFSYPDPDYHTHQSCYKDTIVSAGKVLGKSDRDIADTLRDANKLIIAHKKIANGEVTK